MQSGGGDAVWRRTRRTLAERIDFVFFFYQERYGVVGDLPTVAFLCK
jgi:hypothetical protein